MSVMKIKQHGKYIGFCEEVGGYIYKFGLGFWKVSNNQVEPLTPILRNNKRKY